MWYSGKIVIFQPYFPFVKWSSNSYNLLSASYYMPYIYYFYLLSSPMTKLALFSYFINEKQVHTLFTPSKIIYDRVMLVWFLTFILSCYIICFTWILWRSRKTGNQSLVINNKHIDTNLAKMIQICLIDSQRQDDIGSRNYCRMFCGVFVFCLFLKFLLY